MRIHQTLFLATFAIACTARVPQQSPAVLVRVPEAAQQNAAAKGDVEPASAQAVEPPQSGDQAGAPVTPYRLVFQPFDLTSQLNGTQLRIYVDSDTLVPEDVLHAVAAGTALHGPDGSSVPFDAHVHPQIPPTPPVNVDKGANPKDVTAAKGQAGERGFVEIQTIEPLKPGWHEMSLTQLPSGATVPYPLSYMAKPKFGLHGIRFNTDSAPVVKEVHVCVKKDGSMTGGLTVSEPVVASEIAGALSIGPVGAPCKVILSQVPSPSVQLACPGAALSAPWHIALQPGAKAVSGGKVALISTASPASAELDFSALEEIGGCRYFRF